MAKKWYTVQFSAKLNEDDIKALNKHLYETMREHLGIEECAALDIDEEDDQDDED